MTQQYRLRWNEPGVIDLADGSVIPPDPDGARWREYLVWMYAGNEPLPAVPPPPTRETLSKLVIVSRLTAPEAAAIDAARRTWAAKEQMMWEAAPPMVHVDDPTLNAFLTAVLGEERTREILSTET